MSEYLHHTDKIFRSAYRQFRDEPSADVWKKINDTLDREATRSYKQRSMNLRRISFVLLLLLTVLIIFEQLSFGQTPEIPRRIPLQLSTSNQLIKKKRVQNSQIQ